MRLGCQRSGTLWSIKKTLEESDEDDGHHDRPHGHRQDAVEEEVDRVAVGGGRCYGGPPGVVALGGDISIWVASCWFTLWYL